jgi:hypothetical protein
MNRRAQIPCRKITQKLWRVAVKPRRWGSPRARQEME